MKNVNLSSDQISAVVLAGGFGKRIRHLLPDIPKPMAPVNGKPFLEWVVRYLAAQKIRLVILSTGHLAEIVARHFQSQPVKNARVNCVPETEPLGTAGGFLNAIAGTKANPEAWLVLNGDSLAPAPLDKMFESLGEPEVAGAVLGVRVADASRFGTISVNESRGAVFQPAKPAQAGNPRHHGELAGFSEKKPGAGVINAGVYLFRASTIQLFPGKTPLSFEMDVFPALVAKKVRLKVCVTDAPFLDIGTPESLPLAEEFIRRNAECFEP
jgi:D-glycero-alpha-D-manno-heptose 1-phosphate guanylyltransferase